MPSFVSPSLCLLLMLIIGCTSSHQNVSVHTLPNYDPNAEHRVLFMDFTMTLTGPGKPERVTLTNAIMGNGELKNIAGLVHTPYQIKLQQYYNDKQLPKIDSFAHPLFRSIEIADTDGTLSRKLTSDQEGHLSIRFPYTPTLSKIELYSVTPDNGTQKIYTLLLKP